MPRSHRLAWYCGVLCAATLCGLTADRAAGATLLRQTIDSVQPRIVKIYGAGGFKGLEAYQSGLLISPQGHVLTSWSYVLDTDYITVILNDGRRLKGELLGADPQLEIAVLKVEGDGLPHFNLDEAAEGAAGDRVLAFSNLFGVATGDEPASVQHGSISVKTQLAARRGAYETPYRGPAYLLDAMTNNPGAAGGALVDSRGRLLGVLGKELRNSQTNTWLNYAIPIAELREAIDGILAGNYVARRPEETALSPAAAVQLELLGVVLVPDVLDRTPPFIDEVRSGSAAHTAGLRPDDMVLFVGDRLVQSCAALREELRFIDREDDLLLTVIRGQELLTVTLPAPPGTNP